MKVNSSDGIILRLQFEKTKHELNTNDITTTAIFYNKIDGNLDYHANVNFSITSALFPDYVFVKTVNLYIKSEDGSTTYVSNGILMSANVYSTTNLITVYYNTCNVDIATTYRFQLDIVSDDGVVISNITTNIISDNFCKAPRGGYI
jgi:hypothetical protein